MEGSPNAFTIPPSGVLSEQDSNARAPKRPRLSEDAVAAIHTQCANAETSLEVDHMMLDYLAYQAIKACFASRNRMAQNDPHISLSKSLALADTFLSLFKERHATYSPDSELRFRIQLLKLTALFTQRFTRNPTTPSHGSLEDLRRSNSARSTRWISLTAQTPTADVASGSVPEDACISKEELERNRAHVLHELAIPPEDEQYEDAHYGTMSSVSLLDILPHFMQVSATRNAMSSSNLTERWMHLAGQFMLQACLERQLIFGTMDVVDEAFSWGYLEGGEALEAGAEGKRCHEEINAMFEDEVYAVEAEGWKDVRTHYLKLVFPSSGAEGGKQDSFIAHLETVAALHPLTAFEGALLRFLEAISDSFPEPVLVQLEKGKLDGMTELETNDFMRDCGVGAARFFEAPTGFKSSLG